MINTFIHHEEKKTSDRIHSNYNRSKRNKSSNSMNDKECNIHLSSNNIFFPPLMVNIYQNQ